MSVVETSNQQPAVNVYPNGNSGNGFFGDGAMGGGGIFFWLILFFFMIMFMGWGNNGNAASNGNGVTYVAPMMYGGGANGYETAIRNNFDQAALVGGINSLQTAMQNQAMSLQNCCCENRANIADVKYAIANEACSDRAAVKDALYDLTLQNNANMNAMMNMFNSGIQSLKDDNCKMLMDQKDARIADLERQLTFSNTTGMVNNAIATVIANNEAQTTALEQYLSPTARPAYIVQNPNCCSQNYCGCNGCR